MNAPSTLHFPSDEEAVQIGYVNDLYWLLRMIDEELPKDAILFVEGTSIARKIKDFLGSRPAKAAQQIGSGAGWPKPKVFHLSLEGENLAQLRELAEHQAAPEVCDTLVVYRDDKVLLWAHDAGYGYVMLSRSLPGETIERFRETVPVALRRGLLERLREALRRTR